MAGDLVNTLADLKEKEALAMVQERLDSGDDPMAILDDARTAMEVVGKRFEEHTYFIPDLVYSGEILKAISEIIKPLLLGEEEESEKLGKVLIGTVAGDIHDIGKNIVTFLLEVNGFEVKDVGVDVPVKKFVEAIEEFGPDVVGLSCLLTVAFDAMKDTITAIQEAGLRDKVKIMIGGGVVDANLVPYVGADAFEQYASGAVTLSKKWLGIKAD
ncbi:MAG: cobalamin-dependent protein [Deltaproteobacteria bacterium]|nr:cobalamin-dependent protein [Deltaproteobacteria bacterium]